MIEEVDAMKAEEKKKDEAEKEEKGPEESCGKYKRDGSEEGVRTSKREWLSCHLKEKVT